MAINFAGEFITPRSADEVFDFLSDPKQFAPLLPDFQSMSMQDATHFTVKVKVGIGNIRGAAELKMELSETVKPLRAQYKGQGSAVGSQVTVSAGFDLSPLPEGTKVAWQGETSVFGKLAAMAGGMLEPLGRKNIQKLIDGLQNALAGPVVRAPLQTMPEAPVSGIPNVDAPQSGIAESSEAAVVTTTGSELPQSGTSNLFDVPDQRAVSGAGDANSESQPSEPPAPADLNPEGEHGDHNP